MQAMVDNLFNFSMMAVVEKLIQKPGHPWDLKPEAAMALQTKLSARVIRRSRIKSEDIVKVAGVDIAYRKDIAYAAVAVMNLPDLMILEEAVAVKTVRFPYVPGLFSFREGPLILEALDKLETTPDLLMLDEPFAALDAFTREELWCVLRDLSTPTIHRHLSHPRLAGGGIFFLYDPRHERSPRPYRDHTAN